ncbi:MAG: hypothetical protein ACXAAH_01555 [Promethearchaeota archaeon]|jgi:hypothetical protein
MNLFEELKKQKIIHIHDSSNPVTVLHEDITLKEFLLEMCDKLVQKDGDQMMFVPAGLMGSYRIYDGYIQLKKETKEEAQVIKDDIKEYFDE